MWCKYGTLQALDRANDARNTLRNEFCVYPLTFHPNPSPQNLAPVPRAKRNHDTTVRSARRPAPRPLSHRFVRQRVVRLWRVTQTHETDQKIKPITHAHKLWVYKTQTGLTFYAAHSRTFLGRPRFLGSALGTAPTMAAESAFRGRPAAQTTR